MTHVSTPNVGALPRQRTWRSGSIGAILVIAVGAAIAGGIAVTTDEAPAVNTAGQTFTQLREGQTTPAPATRADLSYLNLGSQRAAEEAVRNAVKQGQLPAHALDSTSGFAQQPGQPR